MKFAIVAPAFRLPNVNFFTGEPIDHNAAIDKDFPKDIGDIKN